MADNDVTDPTPFITLATKILDDRGEKAVFAGMNPVVRRYLMEARRGSYRSPEEVEAALADMEDEMLYEYFPEEYAQREAARAAKAAPADQALEVRAAQKPTDSPVVSKELSAGGRVKLI